MISNFINGYFYVKYLAVLNGKLNREVNMVLLYYFYTMKLTILTQNDSDSNNLIFKNVTQAL